MSQSVETEAVREALARAIENMAEQFVAMGKAMGVPFGDGQRAKHAGYIEAASCVRRADLSDLSSPPASESREGR